MAKDFEYFTSDIWTINKHMERCIGVGSRELHTTMHTFHTGMGKSLKIASTKCGRMWSKWNSHILLLKWKVTQPLQTHQLVVSLKGKCALKVWLSHFHSSTHRYLHIRNENTEIHKNLPINVYNNFLHHSPKPEITQMSINRWMHGQSLT